MKLFFTVLFATFIMIFPTYAQEENLSVYKDWWYYGDVSNLLYRQICVKAFSQIDKRWGSVGSLSTREDWLNRQAEVRQKLKEIAGAFPQKTPLNAVVTGKIKREGFVVEKLYFQSRPGYYVTAALFVPIDKKDKKPAIIYCCGHSSEGFRNKVYQHCILNLVKKGFIVLAFDPVGQGERIQYFEQEGNPVFEPTHEHSFPGSQLFISGLPAANYFIWDGIRAVDYLVSRKEVDPARIGITGRSGGGTQSAYIAAMDSRIIASAPECYITTFTKLLLSAGPQDAEQILLYSLDEGIDMADLIEVRAPMSTLLITTTQDFFSIQGARDVFRESRKAYIAFGKPDHIEITEDDAGHASTRKNREATYAFFQKHLNNPGSPSDEDVDLLEKEDLLTTPTGQVQTFLQSETLFSLNEKYSIEKLHRQKEDNPDNFTGIRDQAISLIGYEDPGLIKDHIFSGRFQRDGYAIEKYLIKGAGDYYIPLLYLIPASITGNSILLLDDKGKASAAGKGELAEQLVQSGHCVAIPDLIGTGELGGGYKRGDAFIQGVPMNLWYAGVLTHKPPLGIRVSEIKIITGFMNEQNHTPFGIAGVAHGTLTSDLLHAAVINPNFEKIALIEPLISYESIVREKYYRTEFIMSAVPAVIGKYDLSDLAGSLAPAKLLFVNPVNARGVIIDHHTFQQTYYKAMERYDTVNPEGFTVSFHVKKTVMNDQVLHWLRKK